jgi:hypothetical protein
VFVAFSIGKDLMGLFGEARSWDGGRVAVAAHLGGAAFAVLYYWQQWRVTNWIPSFSARRYAERPRVQRVHREAPRVVAPPTPTPPSYDEAAQEQLEAQLDAVLDKMNKQGRDSLTPAERAILQRASEVYRRRRR